MRNCLLVALISLFSACTSSKVLFATLPMQADEQVVGPAEGSSTGFMLFQFLPLGQNGRFQAAYQEALQTSGGTRLVDVTIWESWFWAYIGNGYTFHVTGTAVKSK